MLEYNRRDLESGRLSWYVPVLILKLTYSHICNPSLVVRNLKFKFPQRSTVASPAARRVSAWWPHLPMTDPTTCLTLVFAPNLPVGYQG